MDMDAPISVVVPLYVYTYLCNMSYGVYTMAGELFAVCPVDKFPGVAVEPVSDSSRYFLLRLQDTSGRHPISLSPPFSLSLPSSLLSPSPSVSLTHSVVPLTLQVKMHLLVWDLKIEEMPSISM